jgi:hypothetical protein
MTLTKWHRSWFEPTVKYFRNSLKNSFTHLRWDCDVVNIFSVQVCDSSDTWKLLELSYRTNTNNFLAIITHPDWNWVSPISIPAKAPIFGINQPIMESFFLNCSWDPVSLFVLFNQLRLDICDLNEPAIESSVNQRCLRTPAKRIAVLNCTWVDHSSSFFEVRHNIFVGIFDVLSLIIWDFISKFTIRIDRNYCFAGFNQTRGDTRLVIFLTKTWRLMHNSCTCIICDVSRRNHTEAVWSSFVLKKGVKRFILDSH